MIGKYPARPTAGPKRGGSVFFITMVLFLAVNANAGDLFTDITAEAGLVDPGNERGIAWGDYDNDGDLDLLLSNFGTTMRLFRNNQPTGHHWLDVRLESPGGNTRAVGALVQVFAGDHTWVRENNPGTGYQSQTPHQIHFGLGTETKVDSLVVRWPTGEISRFGQQEADRILLLRGP